MSVSETAAERSVRLQRVLLRAGAGLCVATIAVLSLLPGDELVRTGANHAFEHFIAYCGTACIMVLAGGRDGRRWPAVAALVFYAGALELVQNFAPGRSPGLPEFLAGAAGAVFGTLAADGALALLLRSRLSGLYRL